MNCHTQTIFSSGLMGMGLIMCGGAVYAECSGVPISNTLSNGISALIAGALGYMQRPQQKEGNNLPPGTIHEETTKTKTPPQPVVDSPKPQG